MLLLNWDNEARVPLLTQSILFPLFSDAIVLLIHILECLLLDMGYGLWDMSYGIWDMRYGLWDCIWEVAQLRQWGKGGTSHSAGLPFLFLLFDGVFKSFVEVFLMAFCNDSAMIKAETRFEFGISQSKEGIQAFQQDKVMIFREIMKFFFFWFLCFGCYPLMENGKKTKITFSIHSTLLP